MSKSPSGSSPKTTIASKTPALIEQLPPDVFTNISYDLSNQENLNLIRANYKFIRDLEDLNFLGTHINDEYLIKIFKEINQLERGISKSQGPGYVTKKGIRSIFLSDCESINLEILNNLKSNSIKSLGLSHLDLTKENFLNIKKNFPNLTEIYFDIHRLFNLIPGNTKFIDLDEDLRGLLSFFAPKLVTLELVGSDIIKKLISVIPHINVDFQLRSLDLQASDVTFEELSKLLNATSGNLETLDLYGCESLGDLNNLEVSNNKLANLKSLQLSYSSITPAGLSKLLNATSGKLETLDLYGYGSLGDLNDLELSNNKLANLKSLKLSGPNITPSVLNKLLNATSGNLETLDLDGCESLGDLNNLEVSNNKLANLKSLELSGPNINPSGLNKLLNATSCNLEILNLHHCESLGDLNDLEVSNNKIANLMSLQLSGSNITPAGLNKLLNATSGNLEDLDLCDCESLGDLNDLEVSNKLANLKSLNLAYTRITPSVLNKLLNATSGNLETLNLNGAKSLGDLNDLELSNNKLANLKSLDLSESNINPSGLSKLLNATSGNLETLDLDGCESLGDLNDLELSNKNLANLKSLNLSGPCITLLGLNKLLNATLGKLETLNLYGSESLGNLNDLEVSNNKLANLKILQLSESNITPSVLNKLLNATSGNLETLDLYHCESLGDLNDLELNNKLANLKSLNLAYSSVTPSGLNKLLNATSGNLEILNLDGCESLGDLNDLELSNDKLVNLKSLDIRSSNITQTGLKKLIKLAPDAEINSDFTGNEISQLRSEVKKEASSSKIRTEDTVDSGSNEEQRRAQRQKPNSSTSSASAKSSSSSRDGAMDI
jgi:hypothetical protein